jgi:lipopolysaccharide transport system ATP-binding protein
MQNTVISIEHLSKKYQLGTINTGTFHGDLKRWWAKQRGKPDPHLKIGDVDHGNRKGETLWALKDINLQVQQGEAFGIIGSNGAGKSTLLKILSQVTAPTSGIVNVKGRIASLLEVGTGFHPELTGRENIYLNGAIMGMNKAEISRKFDEIVDFSGVEKFIDTPVKRYSSGMYVRLAFAVAAHLEPEILIVDEVLAVGDREFQKKCLGKMGEVAQGGRTVLFVSHNLDAVRRLCNEAVLLRFGEIVSRGSAESVCEEYSENFTQHEMLDACRLPHNGERARFIEITPVYKSPNNSFLFGDNLEFLIELKAYSTLNEVSLGCGIYRTTDNLNCGFAAGSEKFSIKEGETVRILYKILDSRLAPAKYSTLFNMHIGDMPGDYENVDIVLGYPQFYIKLDPEDGTVARYSDWHSGWGAVMLNGEIVEVIRS